MNTPPPASTPSAIHEQILAAAFERFVRFGYNKTTMAEIAKDCDMSAANIYRFFNNKLDIGAQLASQCLSTLVEQQSDIVANKQKPASERLRELVFTTLEYTHNQWQETPLVNELVTALCSDRCDIVQTHRQAEHDVIIKLLEDGNRSKEFRIDDPQDTASAIQTAITLFSMPLLMPTYSREEFDKKAGALVRLLLSGLLNPQQQIAS